MGEILQAMKTFMFLQETEDLELEQGVKKEFLRGTFSIMEFDENSKEMLDELKAKFMNFRKEVGGLDILEFEAAIAPMISHGISPEHILKTFQKMDTSDQGAVTWDDFINFAIEEHSKRIMMNETMDEMPFGEDLQHIRHKHRDPIMRITFMPSVDPNTKFIDWSYGKYMILSREGYMSVWTANMRNISHNDLVGHSSQQHSHSPSWYMDMIALYHNGTIATATTGRDITFYDYTRRGWTKKYRMSKLPNCVSTMAYWAGLEHEKVAVVLWGDTGGCVTALTFDLSQRVPMFGISVREGCTNINYQGALAGEYEGTTVRVYPNVHGDWVKQVLYVPEATAFLSCCNDGETAMYMSMLDPSKKAPCYYITQRGIMCFDYSHRLNILACAGVDCSIWLYNPYIPSKVVAMMEGHIRPVVHLAINSRENYVISIDLSKTIFMHNLSSQRVIQRIPGQSVRMGTYHINTIYLNTDRRMCLLGTYGLAMLKRQRLEGLHVDIRSHDYKLVGALYSPEFQQVVSVCRGSMVRVWDITTGTRVMQFGMAHSKKLQGRWVPVEIECMALTENKRRLCTAAEGVVKIWNFNVGSVLRELDMSNCPKITSIAMAQKHFYVTGWSKIINVFSDFKGEEGVKKAWVNKHPEDILNLCVMEPNMIASCSYDGSVIVWLRDTKESYCRLSAIFGNKPELNTAIRGGGGNVIEEDDADDEDEEKKGEDKFMTIGLHLRKDGGWYRLLRALKIRQIEREKRRAQAEKRDFSARYKKTKKRLNMQGLTLVYESAVECMVHLKARNSRPSPQTATLVTAGAECWIRFWSLHPKGGILGQFTCTRRKLESVRCMTTDSKNEFLFTGDTMGLLRIFDIHEFCNGEKLTEAERKERNNQTWRDFVYQRLPFKPEEMLDTMEKLREMRISPADASKPRQNLQAPKLMSSIRAHTEAIVSLEFIEDRNLILTSSQDLTVRLWTKNCSYIGTFGEIWDPIPMKVGYIVEKEPRVPKDLLRVASAHTLGTLHNGRMPHWRKACYVVRRHIHEQKRERQIEEAREKMKEEKRARGEPDSDDDSKTGGDKPVSKILGKYYQPRKRYRGPMTTEDQGYPKLRMFRGKCSPYNTALPQDLYHMDPLYTPATFFDIDTRRTIGRKGKRIRETRVMMNQFNNMCGNPERFGKQGATPGSNSASQSVSNNTQQAHTSGESSSKSLTTGHDSADSPATPVPDKNENCESPLLARHALRNTTFNKSSTNPRVRFPNSPAGPSSRCDESSARNGSSSLQPKSGSEYPGTFTDYRDALHGGCLGSARTYSSSSEEEEEVSSDEENLTLPEIQLNRRIALYKRAGIRISHLL